MENKKIEELQEMNANMKRRNEELRQMNMLSFCAIDPKDADSKRFMESYRKKMRMEAEAMDAAIEAEEKRREEATATAAGVPGTIEQEVQNEEEEDGDVSEEVAQEDNEEVDEEDNADPPVVPV